ncbi:MAG TPA: hypothetical protein VHE10_03555, partial [Candidatus Paceibacterota bacterium]|nr:hypothetical protein [Candidatus Paceibacterota bacterium]
RDFALSGGYLAPTTTRTILANGGFVSQASSTITGNLNITGNATATQATTTNLAVSSIANSLLKTNGSGSILAAVAGTDYATVAQLWATSSSDYYSSQFRDWSVQGSGLYLAPTTTRGVIVAASSTVFALTSQTSTTTNATTTSLFSTTASSTNLFASLLAVRGSGLVVNANGEVGVGTTTPNTGSALYVEKNANGGAYMQFVNPNAGNAAFASVAVGGSQNTSGVEYGEFDYVGRGYTGSGTIYNPRTTILAGNDTGGLSIGALNAAGALSFYSGGQLSANQRMSITSGGLVGIGSTTPWGLLSVNPNGNGVGAPEFIVGSSTVTHFIVNGSGNIGIGTSTPTAKLEVNGLIYSGTGGFKFPDGSTQITAAGAGGGYATIQDEGSGLTQRTVLNFTGSGVSCADNNGSARTDCTINAGAASAGGTNGQIQFNDGLSLGGAGGLIYVKATGQFGVGTSTPFGALQVATSTRPQIVISDPTAGVDQKHFYASSSQGAFTIGEANDSLTTLTPRLTIDNAGNVGIGSTSPVATLSVSSSNALAAAVIDQTSNGSLLALRASGVDKFVVGNNGGVTISATTNDIVKTSTSKGTASDFTFDPTAILNNVTSKNDTIDLNDSTSTNAVTSGVGSGMFTASATTTPTAMGAGGEVILRDDGQYVVIHGGGTAVSVWDGYSSTMTPLGTTLTANAGAGSIALHRPDGRYLVIHAGGVNTTTLIDPYGRIQAMPGPTVTGCSAPNTGTNAFQRPDGKYFVMCGGSVNTSVYDPTANTFTSGPVLTTDTFGAGAHSIQRDNGTFLVIVGGGTANYLYNPNLGTTGAFTVKNPISGFPAVAAGAFSIRKGDGRFILLPGAISTAYIYDPAETASTTNAAAGTISSLGTGPTVALKDGAQAIWRTGGTYLLLIGSTSGVTNIIDPTASIGSMFTAGQSLPAGGTLNVGATAFIRPNGHYAIVGAGASASAVTDYDFGYVIGGTGSSPELSASYETECMSAPGLNTQSTLTWHTANEGTYTFMVKTGTGSCSGTYHTVESSGDPVRPDNTTDNRVQVKVYLQRDLPKFNDQEWNIRKTGQTRYSRNTIDPTIYDFTINNGALYKKSFIDFASNSFSTSSATSTIPITVNLQVKTDGIGLAYSQVSNPEYNGTVNATDAANFNAAFATSTPLLYGISSSTLVMKRPDGTFVIIAGSSTPSSIVPAQLYNPATKAITSLGTGPTTNIGLGALAVKRPDGKFLIVIGNSTGNSTAGTGTTTTNIYDPVTNTFTYGPPLTGNAGRGALVIPLPTGKYLIVHGSFTTGTSIYDPLQNSTIQGPVTQNVVGGGSMALSRPDGTYLLIPGTTNETCTPTTATNLFDPNQMQFRANPNITVVTGTGPGATAIQRGDGMWLIIKGGATASTCAFISTTNIYNPITNRMIVGPTLAATLPTGGLKPEGTFAIPMTQDGSWLVMIGSASTTKSQIYVEKAGVEQGVTEDLPTGGAQGIFYPTTGNGPSAIATSTLLTTPGGFGQYLGVGPGAIAFQRPDGKFLLIDGSASTTASSTVTHEVDTGWVSSGLYKTEQMLISDLDSSSVLSWKISPSYAGVSAEVKTAATQTDLQDAPTRSIDKPGEKINPGIGEKWIQVTFNFKRDFPSYTGVYQDVWYNGSTPVSTQRTVTQPVLSEIAVTKDIDFLNLQADGATMLRITSNGNIYSADGATINTSGADLAERYTSQVPLENGTVVAIDPQNNHGVMPTTYQYQPDALGVVSTDPGFVAGAYTKDSYPIALIGRVPVKVSTENGIIRTGDKLTPSSVPGYAMKATLAGHVIGHALESFDPSKAQDCPAGGTAANRQCGTIMMFVNLVDYLGASIDDAIALNGVVPGNSIAIADGEATDTEDMAADATTTSARSSASRSQQILAYLDGLKMSRADQAAARSELFADKISAVSEIISPTITTHLMHADSIEGLATLAVDSIKADTVKARDIEADAFTARGLNIFKTSLIAAVAGIDASSTDASTTLGYASTTTLSVMLDELGNGFFAGGVSAQSLTAEGLSVATIGSASTTVDILSDATFFGRPYFTTDTGGSAVIKSGAREVAVVFDREYIEMPIVSATIALEAASSSQDLGDAIFDQDIRYIVARKSATGFTIRLNKPAPGDIGFSWIALAVKNAKLFTSRDESAPVQERVPEPLQAGVSDDGQTGISGSTITEAPPPIDLTTPTTTPAAEGAGLGESAGTTTASTTDDIPVTLQPSGGPPPTDPGESASSFPQP